MILRFAALVTLAASAYFLQRAADPIFEQNAKVRQWPATDVTVTVRLADPPARGPATGATTGRSISSGNRDAAAGGATANRLVEQRHEVAGQVFRTTRFNPPDDEWPPAESESGADRQAGHVRRGYYDPNRPGQVFVPKAFGFRDYLPVFVGAPLFAAGFGGLLLGKRRRPASTAASGRGGGKGWLRLTPARSGGHRARAAWCAAVVCNLLIGLAVYDYFTGQPRARSALGDTLVCLGAAPGLLAVGLAAYLSRAAGRVGEPSVSIDSPRLRPGERIAVKVELPPTRDLDLEHVGVALVCVRSGTITVTGTGTGDGGRASPGPGPGSREEEVYADRAERAVARRPGPARPTFEQRFRVPPNAEPSSLARAGRAPRVDWFVEVHFHIVDGPDYRGRFPVTVEPA